ncbi:MAG: PASTA domain-containing protein [Bacteroidaceae bacterium]|nr:PASTA domain-containing protein [Bacteroidaceae bacterium]
MEMKDTQSQPAKKAVKKRAAADKATTKRKVTVIALNILAMIAVVAALPYFTLLWVDSYTNHGETYAVPDICGIHLKKAVNVLAAQKLDYTIIERRYQENASADEVVVQYPAPGTRVKEGRKIALVINSAEKPKRSIPSVIDNRTYREAESHILAAGFVIEAVDTIPGEKDWVYELKYNGKRLSNGETVPQGSSLRVVIGSGNVKDDNKPVFDSNFDI